MVKVPTEHALKCDYNNNNNNNNDHTVHHIIMLAGKGIGLDVAMLLEMVTIDVDDRVECGEEETIVEVDGIEETIVEVDETYMGYIEDMGVDDGTITKYDQCKKTSLCFTGYK